jgi:hypothetical protein
MKLSEKAIEELKDVLRVDIGDGVNELSDQDLQDMGSFLLTVTATSLKIRARQMNNKKYGE